jgi:iron complex transport system substrate-binding protein
VAVAALAGCGSAGTTDGAAGSATGSGGTADAAASGTVTVEHAAGTTEVPVDPQRVVALHDLDNAYAVTSLGADVVGIGAFEAEDPFERVRGLGETPAAMTEAEIVGLFYEPDLEAIAALRPDLILGTDGSHTEIYDELSAIAPTVFVGYDAAVGFEDNQRLLARITGVEDEMDARLAEYDERVARIREEYADELADLEYTRIDSYGTGSDENFLLLTDSSPGAVVMADLGIERSATNAGFEPGEQFPAISLEQLAEYDADLVVLGTEEGVAPDPQVTRLLEGTSAGRAGQVVVVDYAVWGFAVVDALFVVLDDVERILAENDVSSVGDFREGTGS